MKDPRQQIERFFKKHQAFFDQKAPAIIAKTAVESFKGNFTTKSFDGKPWQPLSKSYKPKKGSMMVRSSLLVNSIRESVVSPQRVVISAGNSKVPYARIHNQGGVINQAARSETFKRNRSPLKGGKGGGKFRKGTTPGQGLTFKARTITIPKRQFMGYSQGLNKAIMARFKEIYKFT